jgi:hypothetical protein
VLLPAARRVAAIVLLADGAAERELYSVVAEEVWASVVEEMHDEGGALLADVQDYAVAVRALSESPRRSSSTCCCDVCKIVYCLLQCPPNVPPFLHVTAL